MKHTMLLYMKTPMIKYFSRIILTVRPLLILLVEGVMMIISKLVLIMHFPCAKYYVKFVLMGILQ